MRQPDFRDRCSIDREGDNPTRDRGNHVPVTCPQDLVKAEGFGFDRIVEKLTAAIY